MRRYEQFGWDYEHISPLTETETAWYLSFARRTGGPVLELACGTARLLTAIARAGYEVEGIDLSPAMLDIARERISGLPPNVTSRIRLHNLDMTDFELESRFGLIIIADNSFSELKTAEQQLSCLKYVYRHLKQDGRFLVTVRRLEPANFPNGKRVLDWSEPVRHPVTNNLVQRRGEMKLVENGKRVKGTFFYKTTGGNGSETVEVYHFEAPVMSKEDYTNLFSKAGFRSNVYADYREKADDGQSSILCFVCEMN